MTMMTISGEMLLYEYIVCLIIWGMLVVHYICNYLVWLIGSLIN